jgi:hypothetical protein
MELELHGDQFLKNSKTSFENSKKIETIFLM